MRFLEFATSDDGQGRSSSEAMASVRDPDLEAALTEARALLATAEASAPGPRGAEEDGGVWDAELQQQREMDGWWTITLTLIGPDEWVDNLLHPFI